MELEIGASYLLSGLEATMWDVGHPRFGKPAALAGRYLGSLMGLRQWFVFEIWLDLQEIGVIVMNDTDLAKVTIRRL